MANALQPSLQEKLDRAKVHIGEANGLISNYLKSRPYRIETDIRPDAEGCSVDVRLFVVKPLPVLRIGSVVGDAVHNLRSVLDYMVWLLTVQNQRRTPELPMPPSCWWRRVSFPIVASEPEWDRGAYRKPLLGIRASAIPRFKAVQPFASGYATAADDPLWVLQELANLDKHRGIPVVFAQLASVPFTPEDRLSLAIFQPVSGVLPFAFEKSLGPIQDGKIIGRAAFRKPVTRTQVLDYLRRYSPLVFDVTFDRGVPTEEVPVRRGLTLLWDRTAQVADELAPLIRPPRYRRSQHCPPLRQPSHRIPPGKG
jgi:hypothetical protein